MELFTSLQYHGIFTASVWCMRAYSYGAQIDEGLPPFEIDSEDIGHAWPDRLLYLKANIARKQDLILEVNPD